MDYITINGVAYLVRVDQGRGRRLQIENRRRALDASLLVDTIASKIEAVVEITGTVGSGRFFTIAEAEALMLTLLGGTVTVGGSLGSFSARARDIGWVDGQHYPAGEPVVFRWVTCTLEQV